MRAFAIWIGVGVLVAALCGAGLAWDGSSYLFQLLDTQAVYAPHYRYATAPLQAIVLLAARFTSALPVLAFVFSLVYASVPLLALGASWLVVRRDARQLFVWAALGIGVATLPGQFFFVAEALIAVQLFWPLWLALLCGAQPRHVPLMLVLVLLLAFCHPFAIPLLGLAALLALLVGWRVAADRRRLWAWAGGLTLAAAISTVAFVLLRDSYQSEQISVDVLRFALASVEGLPLVALVLGGLAALIVAAAPHLVRRSGERVLRFSSVATLVLLGSAGLLLAVWARDPALWRHALDFRFLAPWSALPVLALAAWDRLARTSEELGRTDAIWQQRLHATQLAGGIFALVLALQGASWFVTTSRLRDTISASRWTCVSAAAEPWLAETPLAHWSISPYALLLQGQRPEKVVVSGDGCGTLAITNQFQSNSWTSRTWQGGWFDLTELRDKLTGEQANAQGCSFQFTSGWHQTERDGPYWWRWSDGRSPTIRVLVEKDLSAAFYGQIETIQSPNSVAVLVNGVRQTSLDLAQTGLQPLSPVAVTLKRGVNTVQFASANPPVGTQGRLLALSLANVMLGSGDNTLTCVFHP